MAEDIENDDQWLYGDGEGEGEVESQPGGEAEEVPNQSEQSEHNPPEEPVESAAEAPSEEAEEPPDPIEPSPVNYPEEQFDDMGPPGVDDVPAPAQVENGEAENEREDGELKQNGDEEEDLDDDSDDDVNVVIGDFKTSTSYPAQQHSIKRGGLTTAIVDKSKQIQQPGKFQIEEFEQIGTINGMAACDYSLDSLEDKPWRKPGSDITDYFNYGFNEDTWKAYCERQKRIRINESGVGIMPLNSIGLPRGSMDNKYGNQNYIQPLSRGMATPMMKMGDTPKINTIQVLTADRREYSRKPGFPDISMPPPINYPEPFVGQPDFGFNPEPEPFYGGGYEPTQDSQWMEGQGNPNWQPSDIKTLGGGSPPRGSHLMGPPSSRRSPGRRSASRERDRERERSKSQRPRDNEREKSRRRERSRSRSRRHKSRSRSPSHRSHKKKKSRRHEDSD